MKCKKQIVSLVLTLCMILSVVTIPVVSAVTTESQNTGANTNQLSTQAGSYGLADNVQDGQILQCWNWSYQGIKNNMKKIAEQGFSAVQTSPIQTIKESTQGKSAQGSWWVYYQPSNFNIDSSSQNALGTKSDFKSMCDEAHKYGIKVIVDAVLNHMANKGDNTLSDTIPGDIKNDSSCWHSITQNTSNWNSRWDITHNCMGGLPDLNTGNSKIQNYEIAFMKECIDCGVDGFRFDGAKHLELPNDLENASSNFWTRILGETTNYSKSKRGVTPYYYGEILDKTGGGQNIVNQYANLMSMTINTVSNDIRNSVNSGNANGAKRTDFCYEDGSAPAGKKAVLWNESHDTYADNKSRGQSDSTMNKTWALVGSRAEACGMYLARPANYSQNIGIASVTAWGNKEVKAVNQFKNAMIGESEYMSSEGSIVYNERGTTGVVLVNCSGGQQQVSVTAHKMKAGTYEDAVTGNKFTVSNGKISGTIGSTGIAVVYSSTPKPTNTISQSGGSFKTDTLNLTIGLENATSGTYKIDNGTANTYTGTKTITIGEGVSYGSTITVKLTATNGSEISDATYSFKKVDPNAVRVIDFSNKSTVYMWNTAKWSTVNCYSFPTGGDGATAWPGTGMTKVDSFGGSDLYKITVPSGETNVIFNDGSSQTDDLSIPSDTVVFDNSKMSWVKAETIDEDVVVSTGGDTTTASQPIPTSPGTTYYYGDVNFDKKVNIQDVTLIQKYSSRAITLNETQMKAANVNGDNSVNIQDVTLVQKFASRNVTTFPVGLTFTMSGPGPVPTSSETIPTTPIPGKDYVYFKNSNNWSTVNAYFWSDDNTTMCQWPGTGMESVGNGVYRIEVPSGATYVIFNGGGDDSKTGDLNVEMNKIYSDGNWQDYNG